uniref:transposase n=1 Tax=Rickettsia felis TaxID=42862 RepID=UPI0012DFF3A3|nr:transposase [Rickettsia felis]
MIQMYQYYSRKIGLLKEITKRLVERALQSEMNNHLGYSKYNQSDAQNSRNGYNTKNLIYESFYHFFA